MSLARLAVRRSPARPLALMVLAAVLAALFAGVVAPAGAAHAASYRFWGYYHLEAGKWAFAQTGPDKVTPADGSIEGWRFAVGDESASRFPRATPSFEDICGATPAVAGKKRVGLVLDYGRVADAEGGATPPAPVAKCATVDPKATGAEVLAAVASVRSAGGLTCAIDGYPATGCGGEVKVVSDAAKAADTPVTIAAARKADAPAGATATGSGPSAGTWVTIVVVLALVAAVALVALRRRRQGARV
jgi:MYXO-CTERM domain-containing protein